MRVDDLRPLALLRRAGRRPARRARVATARRCRSSRAPTSSARASTPTSGGCWSTARSTWSGTSVREDTVVGRMDAPGRWAGGFRAWDEHGRLPRHRPRRRTRADAAGAAPRRCVTGCSEWFPFGGPPDRGPLRAPRAASSRRPGSGSRWSRSARSPPASPTRSTTRPPRRPGRSTPSTPSARRCWPRCGSWPTASITADQFARARRAAAARSRPRPSKPDPIRLADRRGGALRPGWTRTGVERRLDDRAAARGRRGRRRLVRARRPSVLVGPTLGARARLGGEHPVDARALLDGGEGVDPPDLRAGRGRAVLLPDGPGLDAAARRDRRPREHAGDARAQAARRGHGGPGVRRRRCPGSRRYAGELNQVWTNLIDNAVDAMDGDGTLRVVTRREPDAVVVEIGDTGAGMPPGGGGSGVRGVLHDQGRRQGHRPRPRHRAADRRRAPSRRDRDRLRAGPDGDAGPAALLRPDTRGYLTPPLGVARRAVPFPSWQRRIPRLRQPTPPSSEASWDRAGRHAPRSRSSC